MLIEPVPGAGCQFGVVSESLDSTRSVKLIVSTQSDKGENRGVWRYRPFPSDADISITVMQVVALRAAKVSGAVRDTSTFPAEL